MIITTIKSSNSVTQILESIFDQINTDNGATKIVRLGGLTDTTDLHANGDYGLQIIKQNTAGSYLIIQQ